MTLCDVILVYLFINFEVKRFPLPALNSFSGVFYPAVADFESIFYHNLSGLGVEGGGGGISASFTDHG